MLARIVYTKLSAYRATIQVGQSLYNEIPLQDWTSPNGEQYLILRDEQPVEIPPDERKAINDALLEFQEYPLNWESPGHTD